MGAPFTPESRRRSPLVRGVLATGVALLALAGASRPAATQPDDLDPIATDSIAAIRSYLAGHADSAHARFATAIVRARARSDLRALARLVRLDAALYGAVGDAQHAMPRLAEAMRLAEACHDTVGQLRILRWQGYSLGATGDIAGSAGIATRLRALARLVRDTTYEALGQAISAWSRLQEGDLPGARDESAAAAAALRARGERNFESVALQVRGSALLRLGDYAEARRVMRRKLALAREVGNPFAVATALNDLGVLEGQAGDPAAAERLYLQAAASHEARAEWREASLTLGNLANLESTMGRHREAREALARVLAICDREGYRAQRAASLVTLGAIEWREDRPHAALQRWRSAIALGDTLRPASLGFAAIGMTRVLAELDSSEAAYACIEGAWQDMLRRRLRDDVVEIEIERSGLRIDRGQARAVAEPLAALAARSEARGDWQVAASAWLQAGRAWRRLGMSARARAALERATRCWERRRAVTLNLDWRQLFTSDAVSLANEWIDLERGDRAHPVAERDAAAYGRLQQFKARTLAERFAGPDAGMGPDSARFAVAAPVPTRLRQQVLHPGELLLDALVGRDSSTVFVISADTLLAITWPGRTTLTRQTQLLRDLVQRPDGVPAETAEAALRAGIDALLAPLRPWIERSSRVIFSADDALLLLPVLTDRPVALVPSAALLARIRERGHAGVPPEKLLAFLSAGASDRPALPRARAEVLRLAERFANVDRRGSQTGMEPLLVRTLGDYGAVHFAGHVVLDDQRPWRSNILLSEGDATLPAARLLAEDVARVRLRAGLAVLSGCESAGGVTTSGEGVSGLASAFMIAGTQTVIASLWPVDDRSTAELMARFYDGLAAGRTVELALAEARESLRQRPATRHPFHWAGWVLIGEPETRIPLVSRRSPWPNRLFVVVLAFAGLTALSLVRRRVGPTRVSAL